jgi:2-polyprenyl-3-methyl-5-hydroxy-6-metoxy-1,4-benzoquinol methylase
MEEGSASSSHRTFRDPAGSLEVRPDGAFRLVRQPYAADILAFLQSPLATKLVADGTLVASDVVRSDNQGLLLRHPRISFISYPSEWPSALWLAAAELTLDLCSQLIAEGWVLKDATPLNILFEGNKPIFVDVLSIERMDESRAIWLPYGQFVRTFVLPVLAHTQLGWPLQAVRTRRDGFEPEEIYAALPWLRRMRQPSLSSVTLPVLLAGLLEKKSGVSAGQVAKRKIDDPEITKQVMLKTLKNLRATMRRAAPALKSSAWSEYAETAEHYTGADHAEKRTFVTEALQRCGPRSVLDVGCNTGVYSRIAADAGAEVVAIDTDMDALERFCAELKGTGKNILPLCVDLAYPTPATGWENRENLSFLERCERHFDTVMMLAVLHHLLLTAQIPMEHIAALCSRIAMRNLILEWVPPSDPKFIEVLRGREAIYEHITEDNLRLAFAQHFEIEREMLLGNGRILFHMVKR